jgi:hypothetical protein
MRVIECTRWFIRGRCVVLCVQVGWFVGVGSWLVRVQVRWETEGFVWKLSDSRQSIRIFEDDIM